MTAPAPERVTPEELPAVFEAIAGSLGTVAATHAANVYAAWQSGALTTAEFVATLGDTVFAAVAYGVTVGDTLGATVLDTTPLGMMPSPVEHARLTDAAQTLADDLDSADDLSPRVERLAASEAVGAAQDSLRQSYEQHGVTGYRRGLDSDPCELCSWLAKRHLDPLGYVYPITSPMSRHPGCCCSPIPVGTDKLPEQTDNTTKAQRKEAR